VRSLDGIFAALHTAFDAAEEVDWRAQREYVRSLAGRGLAGFFVCGTTGEFPFLRVEEREKLLELAVEEARGRLLVLAHVGGLGTRECVRLAVHAERAGAAAVSAVPPCYYAYRAEAVLDHLRAIATSVSVPLVYYHIPQRTGLLLDERFFDSLLAVPGLSGVKYSHVDLVLQERLQKRAGPNFKFYCGCDELLVHSLQIGASGAIGSTYNFLAPIFLRLWSSFQAGRWEEATAFQERANRIISVLAAYPPIASSKEALRITGLPVGEPRRPQGRLTAEEKARFESEITAAGLLDPTLR